MARVRRGFKGRRRRNKILKLAKGFHFDRKRKFKHAAHTVVRALHNAYKARKMLKRNMRKLWVTRISAAAKNLETSYSKFIGALKVKNVTLNRKMLSEIAISDPKGFEAIVHAAK
jgi:large subunit ribosomal protein L20